MQSITILTVGSLKQPWAKTGCGHFLDRLQHDVKIDVIELPGSKERYPDRQREDESQRLAEAIAKRDGVVWALDERGQAYASEEFSAALKQLRDQGSSLSIAIGGAYGLTDAVRDAADRVVRLSDLTMQHELARLVLLEQLYRAVQIQKGTGYHH